MIYANACSNDIVSRIYCYDFLVAFVSAIVNIVDERDITCSISCFKLPDLDLDELYLLLTYGYDPRDKLLLKL